LIEPAAFIAFGLVFFGLTCGASLVSCVGFLLGHRACRRRGVRVERQAATVAVVLPPVLGLSVTLALVARSLVAPWLGLLDHCPSHAHHLHLCIHHGAAWAHQRWAVAASAGATVLLLARLVQRLAAMGSARSALRALAGVGQPVDGAEQDVLLAPSDVPFCFVGGLRTPRIFVSTAAWDRLADDERRAMLEHERAHVAGGDLWRRTLLGALALFGFPVLVHRVLAAWDHATERLCDRQSAQSIGEPTAVARALVVLARAGAGRAVPCAAAFVSRCHVVDRVESVLASEPEGQVPARRLGAMACATAAAVLVSAAVLAEPLHHAIETLLGSH
jgi:Zn-dependent protease with chaperone function